MNQAIKTRIEEIESGKVPSGYKKTKIGIFPVEWTIIKAREVFENISDKKHNGDLEVLSATQDKGVIPRQQVDIDIKYDLESVKNYKRVRKGNFVISLRSFQGGIEYSEYDGLVSPAYTVLGNRLAIADYFYKVYFKSEDYIKRLSIATYGIRDGKQISFEDFGFLYIPYPPVKEQEKIAEILKTQDRVIELKEKLLKEKQREKKYLMQQLLTGKIRLKGFNNEWEEKQLKDIACPITKKVCDRKYEILSITAGTGFVSQSKKFGKEIAGKQYENYILLHKGEFSYNKGNSKKYPQGCIYPLEHLEVAAVPSVFISFSLLQGKCYYGYFKYLFENGCLNRQLYGFINSGVRDDGLLNIYDSDFYSCFVLIPTYKEQQQISEIFFKIDKEINLLQQQIKSEKQKKKALMQLLLSGIVRVS